MTGTPTHVALQYLVEFRNGQDFKAVEDHDGEVPVIGSGGPFSRASDYLYEGESVLFGRKGTIDKPRHERGRFWTVDTMYYTVLGPQIDGRWLYYWATTVPYGLYSTSTALPSMTSSVLGRLLVPVIPIHEQRRIADYLDRETAGIDAMDAELDRLVETLRERRAVVIESVLDSAGPVGKLGYFLDGLPGFAFPAKEFSRDSSDTRLMRGVNVKPQSTDWTDTVYWPDRKLEGLERYELLAGDVVLGMDRPFISSGTRVLQVQPSDLPALLLQRVLRLRPISGSAEFFMLVLMTRAFQDYATPEATGISVPHISEGQVMDFRVPMPSPDEQAHRATSILRQTARIDDMIADAQRLKALLAERRSTLITEVVTGRKEVPA